MLSIKSTTAPYLVNVARIIRATMRAFAIALKVKIVAELGRPQAQALSTAQELPISSWNCPGGHSVRKLVKSAHASKSSPVGGQELEMSISGNVDHCSLQPLDGTVHQVHNPHRPGPNGEVDVNDGLVLMQALQQEPHRALRPDTVSSPGSF